MFFDNNVCYAFDHIGTIWVSLDDVLTLLKRDVISIRCSDVYHSFELPLLIHRSTQHTTNHVIVDESTATAAASAIRRKNRLNTPSTLNAAVDTEIATTMFYVDKSTLVNLAIREDNPVIDRLVLWIHGVLESRCCDLLAKFVRDRAARAGKARQQRDVTSRRSLSPVEPCLLIATSAYYKSSNLYLIRTINVDVCTMLKNVNVGRTKEQMLYLHCSYYTRNAHVLQNLLARVFRQNRVSRYFYRLSELDLDTLHQMCIHFHKG